MIFLLKKVFLTKASNPFKFYNFLAGIINPKVHGERVFRQGQGKTGLQLW